MKLQRLILLFSSLLCAAGAAESDDRRTAPEELGGPALAEQKHFVECLAWVYSPALWFSYNDALYFQARNEAQVRQLEVMKAARSNYTALTNRETRHAIAAKVIAASGIGPRWQAKILLPLTDTNQNLTPTLQRPLHVLPKYKVVQSFAQGDALLQDDEAIFFVMSFGRGAADTSGTNALLIKEGAKTYTADGRFKTVDAFVNVSLSAEEMTILNRVVAACRKEAAILSQRVSARKAAQEFEDCRARATDSNPYMQYLLARCYLEGKGTTQDEQLGRQWLSRAARNGSGDAKAHLETTGSKAPSP